MKKFNVTANRNGVVTITKGVLAKNILDAINQVKVSSDHNSANWLSAIEV